MAPVEAGAKAPAKDAAKDVVAGQPRSANAPKAPAVAPAEPTDAKATLGSWPVWGLFVGAAMVVAGMGTWQEDQAAEQTFAIILGPGSRVVLALLAGVLLLAPRVRRDVAAGFLFGTTAAAAMGTMMAMGFPLYKSGLESVRPGWWLAFFGQGLIAVTGLVALAVSAWRSPLPRGAIAWRDPVTYAVLVVAVAAALLLANYADEITVEPAGYWAAMFYLWALVTAAVGLVAVAARPSQAGRLVLLSWAVTIVGVALSEWVLLTYGSSESFGMPLLVTAAILLAVMSPFLGRRVDPESDHSTG